MFNNLGLYSGVGFPRAVIHNVRRAPVRRLLPVTRRLPYGQAVANIGGSGNDVINIGGTGLPGPQGPQGPIGPPGPPGTIGRVPVTLVTTTPFNVVLADYLLDVNVAGPSSIVLPVSPTGTVFIIKDISGLASTNIITVTATSGALIDGAVSALINTNYGSITLIFNGTRWDLV